MVERIAKLGRRTVAIQADLSRVTEVQRLIADGVTQLGPLDILVNNAGVEKRADFWDFSEADYDFVMDVNLKGVFFTTQAFVRHLLAAKRPGRIINLHDVGKRTVQQREAFGKQLVMKKHRSGIFPVP